MLKSIFSLPADLYKNRRLVMKLAKNDFKTRYTGLYFQWGSGPTQMNWESLLCFIW